MTLAFALFSPGFAIAGLCLAVIPIIIHLLNRRRYKTVQWAAMEFLMRAMRKNRRKMRFEQLLLLATRCSLLVMLGLALARPVGCDSNSAAALGGKTGMHVFVIDTGLSMAYQPGRPGGLSHLEQSKRVVNSIIDKLARGGESVVIITAGHPAAAVVAKPTYNLDSAKETLNRIPQTYGTTDLAGALRLAVDAGRGEPNQPNRHLYLFTDASASAWQAADAAALKTEGVELAKLYSIENFNMAIGPQWNQAVTDLTASSALVTDKPDFGSNFVATVQGFGPSNPATLQWKLDTAALPGGGKLVPDQTQNKQTESETEMQSVLKTGGVHVVTATLVGDDRLPVDNSRSRVVNVVSALKSLIVEGKHRIGQEAGSAENLQAALAGLGANGKIDGFVAPDVISDLELGNKVLSDYRAVMMCAVQQVSNAQADQLARFVNDGGTVMWFVDENTSMDNYNEMLFPRRLMPGKLTKKVEAAGDHGFHFDFRPGTPGVHPLLHNLDQSNTGLETAQSFGYIQMDAPMDPDLRVLNWLPADESAPVDKTAKPDPAILTQKVGNGRVVFMTTSAAEPWITFTRKPVYAELMNELLAGSVDSGDRWMNLLVGDQLNIPSAYRLTGIPALTDPKSAAIALERYTLADGTAAWRSPPLTMPGNYTLATGNSAGTPIAVNVPAAASDIHVIDNASIKAALGGIDIQMSGDQPPAVVDPASAGSDMGWNVMVIVLLLVGAEAFLAMKFGHFKKDALPAGALKAA